MILILSFSIIFVLMNSPISPLSFYNPKKTLIKTMQRAKNIWIIQAITQSSLCLLIFCLRYSQSRKWSYLKEYRNSIWHNQHLTSCPELGSCFRLSQEIRQDSWIQPELPEHWQGVNILPSLSSSKHILHSFGCRFSSGCVYRLTWKVGIRLTAVFSGAI